MDLFTYLMAKNGHNSFPHGDTFSYLLGKSKSGTYTTETGTSISVNNTVKGNIKTKLFGNTSQESDPTPDYPKDIHVVKGNNTITISNSDNTQTQNYAVNIGTTELCKIGDYADEINKSSGNNLLNRTTCEENKALAWTTGLVFNDTNGLVSDYIEVKDADTYRCNYHVQMMFYDSNKDYLGCMQDGGTTIAKQTGIYDNSFTVPSNLGIKYMRLGFRSTSNNNLNMTQQNIMLNKGNTLLDFEPYGTDWYIKKAIGKVVLDGSESWTKYTNTNSGGNTYGFYVNITNLGGKPLQDTAHNNFALSNYFTQQKRAELAIIDTEGIYLGSGDVFYLKIRQNAVTDAEATSIKTWLSTHNTIVYYILNTPTYTIITDTTLIEELDELEKAKSYNETTNITQTNADLPFNLEVSIKVKQ